MTVTVKVDMSDPAGLVAVATYIPPCIDGVVTLSSTNTDIPGGAVRFVLVIVIPTIPLESMFVFLVQVIALTSRLKPSIRTISVRLEPTSTSTVITSGVSNGATAEAQAYIP